MCFVFENPNKATIKCRNGESKWKLLYINVTYYYKIYSQFIGVNIIRLTNPPQPVAVFYVQYIFIFPCYNFR